MNKVSGESIKQLLEHEDSVTVSIYFPTHRFPTSDHISEDKIRFKNLIRAAKEMLVQQGSEDGIVEQIAGLLEKDIYDSEEFWQATTEGAAVFCSPAEVRFLHLPMECDEFVSVGDRYDIAPLLVAGSCDMPYYLLALAVHNPVLYKGDMYGIERVNIDLPKSPEEALGIDELFSNSQTARAGGYRAGNPGVKSHGQGDSKQAGQEEQLKFFRIIDEEIQGLRNGHEKMSFLLAGTDDDVSGYREVSKLKGILEPTLRGNYTETAPHEIHDRAWPLVKEAICDKVLATEIEKLESLLGTGKASTEQGVISVAASEGRVATLLLGMLDVTRDTVNDSEAPAVKLRLSDEYSEDIRTTCRTAFDQGGKVMGVLKDSMPEKAIEAAIFRY